MKFHAVYESRINGLTITVDGVYKDFGDDSRADQLVEAILERTDELTDEGLLQGDMSEVEAIIREEIAKEYGEGHEITVEEDAFTD